MVPKIYLEEIFGGIKDWSQMSRNLRLLERVTVWQGDTHRNKSIVMKDGLEKFKDRLMQ
jgi:hypothetical protein